MNVNSMKKERLKRKIALIGGFPAPVEEFSEADLETMVDIARALKRHGIRVDPAHCAACFPEVFRIAGLIEKTLTKLSQKSLDARVGSAVEIKDQPAGDPKERSKAELEGNELTLQLVQLVLDTAFWHGTVRHG